MISKNFNPEDFGLVKERTEGTLYIMRKLSKPSGWCEAVVWKLGGKWHKETDSKYRVLWSDVTQADKSNKKDLEKIFREAGLLK